MSTPVVKNVIRLITPRKSPVPRNGTVARCLFPPRGSAKVNHTEKLFVTPQNNQRHRQRRLPSFDTPYRKLLSPSGLDKQIKGFILGRGSYGVVVRGKYKNELVAVKIIHRIKEHSQYSLIRERHALGLSHPNIVQVFHVAGQKELNMGFVFMELYSHTNLENVLQQEIIPLRVKLRYIKETGSALEYCHKNGIIHMDVKPKNIIVNSLGNTCKLCDFGSSVSLDDKSINTPTQGTIKYSAPEILRGESASEKADIYSFGITMWQIINQETPYKDEDLHVIIFKVVTQNYRPKNHVGALNDPVRTIYTACWNAEPSKRPSMSCVSAMLKEIKLE